MHARWSIVSLIAVCLAAACSDSTAPQTVTGEYVFGTWTPTVAGLLGTPFTGGAVDSAADDIQLQANMTYTESGYIAAHLGGTFLDSAWINLGATGTYTVSGDTITLVPATGGYAGPWLGVIVHDTLTLNRYPGTWTLTKAQAR